MAADEVLTHVLGPEGSVGRALGGIWPGVRPVRIVSFTKDASTNWAVPWHQDRIIAVQDKADVPGFTNWSSKGGRWHCEPPRKVLDAMLFVRMHLDAATSDNGAMEIALGSHRAGIVPAEAAERVASEHPSELCLGERGEVLVLKMLTLHRSRPATSKEPRRALRVDYAGEALPEPLHWSA